ncbi:DUF3710 domain-containing protein [Nocardioides sp.]|uniref:DUF3710 domain-containing protein n=1 Tax=Nocardioides sp. TaxID=35761 RepID=UPI0035118095
MRLRRKGVEQAVGNDGEQTTTPDEAGADGASGSSGGPWDADELPEDDDLERIDLGSIALVPLAECELRVQVDEPTGEVRAVLLATDEGAVELRAFAAPRHGDLWEEVRPQIAADTARRGGTATEQEGRWGTELVSEVRLTLPDGQTGVQTSRIVGVNGPRWMLRATFLGEPARDPETAAAWDEVVGHVVVRRGAGAMPVGEQLPLTLPDGSNPRPAEGAVGPGLDD